jgi:hypothetical protein
MRHARGEARMIRHAGRILLNVATLASLTLAIVLTLAWWPTRGRWEGRHVIVPIGERTLRLSASTYGFDATLYLSRPPTVEVAQLSPAFEEMLSGITFDFSWLGPRPTGWWSGSFRFDAGEGRLYVTRAGLPDWQTGPLPAAIADEENKTTPLTESVRFYHVAAPAGAVVWPPLLLPAIRSGAWFVRRVRDARRRCAGHCSVCGYDLRASPDRCPECGTAAGMAA